MIGAKRERLQFQRKVRVKRNDGGYDVTLTDLGTYWASVEPYTKIQLEIVQSGKLTGPQLYIIQVDQRAITPTVDDTITWVTAGNLQLNIREVKQPIGREINVQITAEFGVTESG